MGRTLALDVGSKTIGIAVSDPMGIIAQPVETWSRVGRRRDVEHVAEVARTREVEQIVVGLPIRTDGGEGPEALEARRIAEALSGVLEGVPISLQDERFTTAQARRSLIQADVRRSKRKQVIDQVAAVLILQSWLDTAR
jgi:putative Holliday junction resolvase